MKKSKYSPAQVRHIRTKVLRLSLQKLANAMGVSRSSVINWEQGKTSMLPAFEVTLSTIVAKGVNSPKVRPLAAAGKK